MSPDQEARALTELDRRLAAATSALRHQLDLIVPRANDAPGADEPDEASLVRLDRGSATGGSGAGNGRQRRAVMALAAVIVLVAGVVTGIVATRDERGTVTSDSGLELLMPRWLPDGVMPVQALRLEDVPEAGALGGEVVAYGQRNGSDPWAGPILVASRIVPDPATTGDETQGETVTIDGQPATVSQHDGGTWTATWSIEGARLQVEGRVLTREQVIAAAESTSPGPAIDAAGLPDGFTELARGPLDAMLAGALGYSGSSRGLAVNYALAEEAPTGTPFLSIVERAGPASAVDLARLTYDEARSVTVRGQHGVLASTGDEVLLQWAEPDGLLVTMQASHLPDDDLLRVADGLRPAGAGEIDQLVAENSVDQDDGDGDGATATEASGDVGSEGWVVEGQYEGQDWLLQAFLTGSQVRELWLHGGNNTAPFPMDDGISPSGLTVTSALFDGGVVSVFGLVDPAAVSVTIEPPGRAPTATELHPVDGATLSAFVGFVLETDVGESTTVVARTSDGTEVARATVGSPLRCVDHPDGRRGCTTAST